MDNIYRHEMELLEMLQNGLVEIPGVNIMGTTNLSERVATMSITVDNFDPGDIGTFLDVDYNVQTRTGLQCAPLIHDHMGTSPRGTVRFSAGPFNTTEHIELAIKAVQEVSCRRNK
jgi:selenocysteine lyase/cysteine desulfurase